MARRKDTEEELSVYDQPSLRIKHVQIALDDMVSSVHPSAVQVWLDRGWTLVDEGVACPPVDDENNDEADSGESERENI